MPRRRRMQKRRIDPQAEARAWAEVFETGFDFFDDLADIGLTERKLRDDGEFLQAAAEAWRRHGAQFVAGWQPKGVLEKPWALEEFGSPACR